MKNLYCFHRLYNFAGERINLRNSINLIAKKINSIGDFFACRKNINHVTPNPKCSPMKIYVISLILNIRQLTQ